MKKFVMVGLVVTLLAGASMLKAQDEPKFPTPQKEHEWLNQLVGEWESECECSMDPGKPPVKLKGKETSRSLGGFWVIGEGQSELMGISFTTVLTLGYDPEKKKYLGTWVDSASNYLWKYEGTVDATGKILTLETEGPCPMAPDKKAKFREVIEVKSKDHKVFTSSMQGDDGKWTTIVTVTSKRKK